MKRALALAAVAVLCAASTALAHSSGCHSTHSCPSDHHTYVWLDGSGTSYDCAEPGAPEYNPQTDTITISYAGLTYYCHSVGAPPPPPPPPPPPLPPPPPPPPPPSSSCHYRNSGRLPDARCTPGATLRVGRPQVCRSGYSRSVRNVSTAEKAAVYVRYNIRHHRPFSYEIDHLIPLELGGSNALRNLWPEPYGGRAGARVKDRLENALHRAVCAGRLGLRAAQHQISTNWYQAWIKDGRP